MLSTKIHLSKQGRIQVIHSPSRQFYESAVSQAMNAAAHGSKVLFVQFLKGGQHQGPNHPVMLGNHFTWIRPDTPRSLNTSEFRIGLVASSL
jgi:cob(I)alamin adenosyltransferase